ncbi:hypothetical protein C7460_111110 [Marinoscillum furvescens DSM 4134]|uniref:Uncharacterized protein n=1 Tax=Marinoscillum furvescens DSM 4134 TaxID=1122208 RepID=A0A3D9L2P9_MARFU|nr:hypothetical protein C7460_111110 [Marinoscillum furvescens DSM 4134]
MGIENYFFIVVVLVVIPLFFWWRVKTFNRQKNTVVVKCPSCATVQRLSHLHNYTCKKCSTAVRYLDDNGALLLEVNKYHCVACGAENPKGVLTCISCGLANAERLSS